MTEPIREPITQPITQPITDPGPATPDDSDWTWVLARPCPDCGFDTAAVRPEEVSARLREAAGRYAAVLVRDDVRTRPAAGVWSPLEYTCHVRDVCDVMRARIEQILSGAGSVVQFANWDQDETASEKQYWRADPAVVRRELADAFQAAVAAYERPSGEQWQWPALRSNGSEFTAATLAKYFLHDVQHHLWDVNA
jgi:hypothetical protein